MTLKELKKELIKLKEAETRLLEFLIHYPEHQKEAVQKIFEVCSLIIQMANIIKEMEKNPKTDD